MARGEFSNVIASLGVTVEADLSALAGTYVLITVIAAPIITRLASRQERPTPPVEIDVVPETATAGKAA